MNVVKLWAILTKRFVRSAARDAFRDRFAATVAMSLRRTSATGLDVLALECLMPDLLAVIALFRSVSALKLFRES
jgi:hypothetical protein